MNVPATITTTVAKSSFTADGIDALDPSVLSYIFEYGLRQILNDAGSQFKTPEDKIAAAVKKLETLRSGVIRMKTTRESDPIKAEAIRIATEMVEAAIKAAAVTGKCPALKEWKASDVRVRVNALITANPAIRETAESNVAAKQAIGAIEIDFD